MKRKEDDEGGERRRGRRKKMMKEEDLTPVKARLSETLLRLRQVQQFAEGCHGNRVITDFRSAVGSLGNRKGATLPRDEQRCLHEELFSSEFTKETSNTRKPSDGTQTSLFTEQLKVLTRSTFLIVISNVLKSQSERRFIT